MIGRIALLLVALVACKPAQVGLDGACEEDLRCLPDFVCRAGLRAHKVCMKTCGPTRIEASLPQRADLPVEDTTCPTGWSCSAMLVTTYKDERGREQAAFAGFTDQPMCVPDGWKPAR